MILFFSQPGPHNTPRFNEARRLKITLQSICEITAPTLRDILIVKPSSSCEVCGSKTSVNVQHWVKPPDHTSLLAFEICAVSTILLLSLSPLFFPYFFPFFFPNQRQEKREIHPTG